jgi:hypothetical protein
MPQAITPAMVTALASKLQIGAAKRFEGEIEIDWVQPAGGGATIVQQVSVVNDTAFNARTPLGGAVTAGNLLVAIVDKAGGIAVGSTNVFAWNTINYRPFTEFGRSENDCGSSCNTLVLAYRIATGDERDLGWNIAFCKITIYEIAGADDPTGFEVLRVDAGTTPATLKSLGAFSAPGSLQIAGFQWANEATGGDNYLDQAVVGAWALDALDGLPGGGGFGAHVSHPSYLAMHASAGPDPAITGVSYLYWGAVAVGITSVVIPPQTFRFQVETMTIDRSRTKGAAQLDVTLPNVDGTRGYYRQTSPIFVPNNQCRGYAWYGVRANRVRVFTGLLDRDTDHRDPDVKTVDLKARGRTKLLLAPHVFVASAPQGAGETGAVRTEANGVFVNRSPEYVAAAILDLAGWPAADRALGVSGVTIPEFDLADGGQWLDQIASAGKLTTIAGWDAGEDELGVFHFGPNLLAAALEPDPDWTFQPGLNVLAYDHQVDDEERVTRVRVSGPMSSTVPIWKEEWGATFASSANLGHPTGVMYRASEPDYIYVVDRITGFLCKVRQSDRVITAKWDLGPSLTNQPIGLSGDPTDSLHFYVLDAHLPGSGTYTNCKVRKYAFSAPTVVVSTTSLPDGQWSDMKFDGTHLWLTNFGDDKLYEKTFVGGGAAGATASFSYAGHTNPTGMYLSGTTLGLFFNGGAAFYLVSTSAPGAITGTQSTKGTHIEGGEIDTTTGVDLYAVASAGEFGNTAGYVWKFALAEQITVDVVKWATDQALEDSMGLQAGLASRIHDLHPGDGAHAWERRDKLVTLVTVNTEDQAQAVADALLTLAKRLRRTQDLVTIGNPAIQLGDAIEYPDTVAGSDAIWMLDTKRESLTAGQYVTSMSVLPWEAP